MPPTYSPFWKPFEALGRIGLTRRRIVHDDVRLGPAGSMDCFGGEEWRQYATAERLFDLWGPVPASPWSGYHRATLFAALDSLESFDLWPMPFLPVDGAPRSAPRWLDETTAVVLDLPGEASVAYAAWMAHRDGAAPVVTFNNWPHKLGIVDMARSLGALLYYAPWAKQARDLAVDEAKSPPVFVLDRRRLGDRKPRPKDFDNRYFLLDSDLPSAATLAARGIARLVYVRPDDGPAGDPNAPRELDDLNVWLHDLGERVRVHVAEARLDEWAVTEPRPYAPAVRKTPFTTTTDPAFRGFRRNAAGGFGVLVPEPSSGGG